MGYALWLIPAPHEQDELRNLMEFRPPRKGSWSSNGKDTASRSYPYFEPHITLASFETFPENLNLESIVPKNASAVTYFSRLLRGDNYLGAIKLEMEKTDSLNDLHEHISNELDKLGVFHRSRGFPHMSLFYVDEDDERKRLEQALKNRKLVAQLGKTNRLAVKGRAGAPALHQFTGAEIWLTDCVSRNVEQWSQISSVALSTSYSATAPRNAPRLPPLQITSSNRGPSRGASLPAPLPASPALLSPRPKRRAATVPAGNRTIAVPAQINSPYGGRSRRNSDAYSQREASCCVIM